MKITNTDKGEAYQLSPDTQLSVERTNPFFKEYGEQTVPIAIPASEHNRRLLAYPDMPGLADRIPLQNVTISDGEYFAMARQAVLSAQRKGSIQTSFYMNEGAFYTVMKKTPLKSVFAGEREFVPGVNSVTEGLQFCRTLLADSHPHFAIFPVLVDDDSGQDTGYDYKFVNACGTMHPDGSITLSDEGDFIGAAARTEYVDGTPVTLAPGYYVTPFIRANYALQCVFAHFGYELDLGFFGQTLPFTKMVIVNNCIDSMVNGHIRMQDLVPDVKCNDLLNLYRRKFNCEFIPDERSRRVSVVTFNEVLDAGAATDLTARLVGNPEIDYRQDSDRERIVIKPSKTLNINKDDDKEDEDFESIGNMLEKYPNAWYDYTDGLFYQTIFRRCATQVTERLTTAAIPYDTDGEEKEKMIEVPECIPELAEVTFTDADGRKFAPQKLLYIGKYHTYNSNLTVSGEQVVSKSTNDLKLMLAVPYSAWPYTRGLTCNRDYLVRSQAAKLWDYSLLYNGQDGVFEKFYRRYDTLLRNAMDTVKAELLLSQTEKMNIPSHRKIMLSGVECLPDKLKFTLGARGRDPQQSELKSLRLLKPVGEAPVSAPDYNPAYYWVAREERIDYDYQIYRHVPGTWDDEKEIWVYPYYNYYPDAEFTDVFTPLPDAQLAETDNEGNPVRHYEQTHDGMEVEYEDFDSPPLVDMVPQRQFYVRFYHIVRWLECLPL